MHVLVTGGAGFIGSHLSKYHIERGDHVHVVDNLSTGSLDNIQSLLGNSRFRFSHADILVWDGLDNAIGWADRIYHMAAIVGVKKVLADPAAVMSANMAGTERVVRSMHKGRWDPQLVIASSSEVYGFNDKARFAETDEVLLRAGGRLRWCYAVSKLADEYLGYAYAHQYGLNIVITRLFNTIGPHQVGHYGMVVPNFVRQAVNDEVITVFGDGSQSRSFCDVRDTIVALDLLASSPAAKGEVVNVGSDHEISIKNLAELVVQRAGSSSQLQYMSYEEAYGIDFDDISHRRPDLSKLKALTGFKPKWDLESTIDDLIQRARATEHPHTLATMTD